MKWAEGPMLGFDLETTGINAHEDRIVTACLVDIRMGQRPAITRWLANPGVEIPEGAAAVHGVTTEHAREHGQPIDQVLFELTGRIAMSLHKGVPVVAFNAAYDFTLLEAENHRHGIDPLTTRLKRIEPVIDPFVLDKQFSRRKGSRKLVDVAAHYGVVLSADGAHDSSTDALAACRLFPRILAKHRELQSYPLAHLHQMQIKWRAEQMNSLRAYFDRQGKPHDGCDPGWPLMTTPQPTAQEALL